MKKLLVIMLCIGASYMAAGEIDDFKYISGLYLDGNYSFAQKQLTAFIKEYQRSDLQIHAKYLLANIYMRSEEYSKAHVLYAELYIKQPDVSINDEINLAYIRCLLETSDYVQAEKILNKKRDSATNWRLLNLEAMLNVKQDKLSVATELYASSLEINYNSLTVWEMMQVLIMADNEKLSRQVLDKVLRQGTSDANITQAIIDYAQYQINKNNPRIISELEKHNASKNQENYEEFTAIKARLYYLNKNYLKGISTAKEVADNYVRADYYLALNCLGNGEITKAKHIFEQLTRKRRNDKLDVYAKFQLAKMNAATDLAGSINAMQIAVEELAGDALYTSAVYRLALMQQKNSQYNKAAANYGIVYSLDKGINKEKALFLKGECLFFTNEYTIADSVLADYQKRYAGGEYKSEALFKRGIIAMESQDYVRSGEFFKQVSADSEKAGLAEFYLAKLAMRRQDNVTSEAYFLKALAKSSDKNIIYEGMCELYIKNNELEKAGNCLAKLPKDDVYGKNRHILAAGIHIKKREYGKAIKAYQDALSMVNETSEQIAISLKIGQLYYTIKDFKKAAAKYQEIATLDTSGESLLLAANSVFSADKYNEAINIYIQYMNKFPHATGIMRAKLGIADSYYNLQKYEHALTNYKEICGGAAAVEIKKSALNGIEWATANMNYGRFLAEIKLVLATAESNADAVTTGLILQKRLEYEINQEAWGQALITIQHIYGVFPQYKKDDSLKKYKARSLTGVGEYKQAMRLYKSGEMRPDAQMYNDWYVLDMAVKDTLAAISHLATALVYNNTGETVLKKLALEYQIKSTDFVSNCEKARRDLPKAYAEKASLLLTRWYMQSQNYVKATEIVVTLKDSEYPEIKAKAYYRSGQIKYAQNAWEDALVDLLRVRYLYPDNAIALKAEELGVRSYLHLKQYDEALKALDMIINDLDEETVAELSKLLKDKGGK